ncbi:MAG: hypothetical protein ABIP51_01250 [Bacteroidia bacterium]
MDKNRRVKLLKEETINEITLNDLLDLAGKSEIAVMQLADSCMKFNSSTLKQGAAAVKKQLSELSDMIRSQIMGNDNSKGDDMGVPDKSLDRNPSRGGMHNSNNVKTFESRKFSKLLKSLKEAIEDMENNEDDGEDNSKTVEKNTSKIIDLSQTFTNLIEGLSDEQFETFKTDFSSVLKGSGITDGDFMTIVTNLEETESVDDFNITLDSLYDYADKNGIEIVTDEVPVIN